MGRKMMKRQAILRSSTSTVPKHARRSCANKEAQTQVICPTGTLKLSACTNGMHSLKLETVAVMITR